MRPRAAAPPGGCPAPCAPARAARLEARHVLSSRHGRLALRQQEIARVAGLHFYAIADAAQIGDFLKENDVHAEPSVLVGVRQQCQITRALHREGELALVVRLACP